MPSCMTSAGVMHLSYKLTMARTTTFNILRCYYNHLSTIMGCFPLSRPSHGFFSPPGPVSVCAVTPEACQTCRLLLPCATSRNPGYSVSFISTPLHRSCQLPVSPDWQEAISSWQLWKNSLQRWVQRPCFAGKSLTTTCTSRLWLFGPFTTYMLATMRSIWRATYRPCSAYMPSL